MTETKVKRTTDARIWRLRKAKYAAAKIITAGLAVMKANARFNAACGEFDDVVASAESAEERAFLESLSNRKQVP